MTLRVVFMGTPDFSVPTLAEILGAGHEVVAVYCQPPRPAGRGMEARRSPVQVFAEASGIPVLTPKSLKGAEEQAAFAAHAADVAVVVAYGLILPKAILDAPREGCLNLHGSALPRWRGAAPIQRAIMAGDARTAALERGSLVCTPQPADGVTYAAKIDKDEARIDFALPAGVVHNRIRGLSPFPGAWLEVDVQGKRERIKVLRSSVVGSDSQNAAESGTLLDGQLTVACGTGAIRLVEVQRAGKKAMTSGELLRGLPLPAGLRLQA